MKDEKGMISSNTCGTDITKGSITKGHITVSPECTDKYTTRNLSIPGELRVLKQWGVTKAVWDDSKGKYAKYPFQANGNPAKSNDSSTWTFHWNVRNAEYLAFFLNQDYTILDFDDVIHDGVIEPWVADLIRKMHSYTEISVSGKGLHIILNGTKPEGLGSRVDIPGTSHSFEIYDSLRFFLITGRVHKDYKTINPILHGFFTPYLPKQTFTNQPKIRDAGNYNVREAANILLPYWEKADGMRNELALAIDGMIARMGVSFAQRDAVLRELAELTGKGTDHVAVARYTDEKLRTADGKVMGRTALIKVLDKIKEMEGSN